MFIEEDKNRAASEIRSIADVRTYLLRLEKMASTVDYAQLVEMWIAPRGSLQHTGHRRSMFPILTA